MIDDTFSVTQKQVVDITFDFTTDTPGYWDNFWSNRNGIGVGSADPDSLSLTLKRYHKILWSKELPNGDFMQLEDDYCGYLKWGQFRFSSDSITASFNYERCRSLLEDVSSHMEDYHSFVESYMRRTYTIGGCIIFPRHRNSLNQCRGTNKKIIDRWDLTLECIRRFYADQDSPLSWCLEQDRKFFDLFIDFKGYVDFFFLQDCVTDDYRKVKMWLDTKLFESDPFPKGKEEYLRWIQCNLDFVGKRNTRIASYLA